MSFKNHFGKFNSRLVKLLRERIVNSQSGNEHLFQIRNSKVPKIIVIKKIKNKCLYRSLVFYKNSAILTALTISKLVTFLLPFS